jgi:hypothetical protein
MTIYILGESNGSKNVFLYFCGEYELVTIEIVTIVEEMFRRKVGNCERRTQNIASSMMIYQVKHDMSYK